MLGFRVFLACIVKGAEIDTAGFSRKEQQFNIAVWCRKLPSTSGAAPGSGVSWGPGVPGAAAVSGISCSSGTKQSLELNPFHLKEMHLCRELCLWFILSLHCYLPFLLQSRLFFLKNQ